MSPPFVGSPGSLIAGDVGTRWLTTGTTGPSWVPSDSSDVPEPDLDPDDLSDPDDPDDLRDL